MADKPALEFRIVNIEEQYRMNATGKLVLMKIAHYETRTGDSGTAAMSADKFDSEEMESIIRADVEHIARLRGM